MQRNDLAIVNTIRDDLEGDVEVRPLLAILRAAGVERIDALKIDIEGAEYAALAPFFRDAPPCLWPTVVCIEHLGEKRDVLQVMESCGYADCGRTRNNSLYRRADNLE